MPAPANRFKARLKARDVQIGLWMGLGEATTAELCARTGFDWLVVDGEHSPIGLREVRDQLRVVQPTESHPVVRVPSDDRAGIKQMLDVGAQTILIPMIETGAQAAEAVKSCLYPPEGVRGVGASLTRCSLYGTVEGYLPTANAEICVLLQVETMAGIEALDDILAVPGVDGIFIGPSDLSADMGLLGNPTAPEVLSVIDAAIDKIHAAGVAAGILMTDPTVAKGYAEKGVEFLAVGADVGVLRSGLVALRSGF